LPEPGFELLDDSGVERVLISSKGLHHLEEPQWHSALFKLLREWSRAWTHHSHARPVSRKALHQIQHVALRTTDGHIAYNLNDRYWFLRHDQKASDGQIMKSCSGNSERRTSAS
jgi:hypothetical protein